MSYQGPVSTIEDVISIAVTWAFDRAGRADLGGPWFERFINNVYSSVIFANVPLTTQQAKVCVEVVRNLKPRLVPTYLTEDMHTALVTHPVYRYPLTPSKNIPREVRYLGDALLGFRFKMREDIVSRLKQMGATSAFMGEAVRWDGISRMWIVPLNRDTIEPLMDLIGGFQFDFDDEVARQLAVHTNSLGGQSAFVFDAEANEIVVSVPDNELLALWVKHVLQGEEL